MSFEIFSDAGANFIGNAVVRYPVSCVEIPITSNGRRYQKINTGNAKELRAVYRDINCDPDSSSKSAGVEDYIRLFEGALKQGKEILFIGLSSAISESVNTALNVANRLKEQYKKKNIIILDSLSASMGQGMLVGYACRLKEQGMGLSRVYDALEERKRCIRHFIALDSPNRLLKTGRLKKLNYNPDTPFNVKTVIGIDKNGKLAQVARTHGKARAIAELAGRVESEIVNPREQSVYIAHTDCAEDAWSLRALLSEKIPAQKIIVDYADPCIAAQVGPGAVGVFFYGNRA